MSFQIIRNLLLLVVLAFAFNSKTQSEVPSGYVNHAVQSVLEQSDDRMNGVQKFHTPSEELRICALSHLNAPVQESIVSLRRVEYSRSEESTSNVNFSAVAVSAPTRRIETVTVNDRHCNSALCHNSRYYIYKFGALLI